MQAFDHLEAIVKKGTVVMVGLLVWAGVITAQTPKLSSRSALIDQMHAYYVKQFDNLKMVKDGLFGTSRIESSKIKEHYRDGGDPGLQSKEWFNIVQIYGNHGNPLQSEKLELRYSRTPNGLPAGYKEAELVPKDPAEAQKQTRAKARLIETAVKRWASGKIGPWGAQFGGIYMQVRPLQLDKSECLDCHRGMKLGDPVAAMVYTVAQRSR